jgi:hypothetical protein
VSKQVSFESRAAPNASNENHNSGTKETTEAPLKSCTIFARCQNRQIIANICIIAAYNDGEDPDIFTFKQ